MAYYRSYSDHDRKFITDNYLKFSDAELAAKMNRTVNAICQERNKMRLIRPISRVVRKTFNKAIDEAIRLRQDWVVIQDMKALIIMCQIETNTYKKDKLKSELKKLSGL